MRVLVSTTTHMYLPDQGAVVKRIIEADLVRGVAALQSADGGIVACFAGFDQQTGKVTG